MCVFLKIYIFGSFKLPGPGEKEPGGGRKHTGVTRAQDTCAACRYLGSIIRGSLVGKWGAVQAGTAKFLLLLGNRTDPTVNMGNEGFVCVCQSRFNFLLNAEALASLSSAPRSNFGRGVAVKVTARGEVSSSVDL